MKIKIIHGNAGCHKQPNGPKIGPAFPSIFMFMVMFETIPKT
jgi:hypothetical protein